MVWAREDVAQPWGMSVWMEKSERMRKILKRTNQWDWVTDWLWCVSQPMLLKATKPEARLKC